jgi:hypothetical protein
LIATLNIGQIAQRVSRTTTRRTGARLKARTNLSWSSSRRFSSKAASNPSYARLRTRPSTFRKHNSYQRIGGTNSRRVWSLATEH